MWRATIGSVVVVVDCNDDFDARINDPFTPDPATDQADWTAGLIDPAGAAIDLPLVTVATITPV